MSALEGLSNPFEGTVVADAWSPAIADVPTIHQGPFEQCLRAIESARRGRTDSLLIYGPAGSGKTHLLARLQAHLAATANEAPDRGLHCVFVSVKLQTNAQLLWQLVRRRLASDLLRKQQGITQLQRLVAHQLAAARGKTPPYWVRALRVLPSADSDSVSEYLLEVADRLELGRDLCVVLDHLVNNRFVMDARAWLSGDSLPEHALARLGLGPDEQEDREDAARKLVTALCRLAGETLPIVFCFDQIEALQATADDRDALFRFGRMAADLSEADDNVLLISCIQSTFDDLLQSSVRSADRDRIFKRRARLDPLNRAEVEALVISRLDSVEALREMRAAQPGQRFYPFDGAFISELAHTSPCVPRRVIAASATAFEALQYGRPAPAPEPPRVDAFLDGAFAARRETALAQRTPEESRETLMHGLPLLFRLRGEQPAAKRVPGLDLILPSRASPLALAICNETNMKSLAAHLRQLAQSDDALKGHRLRIVRDPRLPITKRSARTQDYLVELEKKGARMVQPSVEALAALEALRSLLSDARAGDLATRGDALPEAKVGAWLRQNLDEALVDLCDALEGDVRAADPTSEERERNLDELMLRRLVSRLDTAAAEIGCSADDVIAIARRHPDRFGVLEGPPVVLFVHVPADSLGGKTMAIELSVKDVREALSRAAGDEAGAGEPATRLLGTLFHEVFADLVGRDPARSGVRVALEAGRDEAGDRLRQHTYRALVGPRIARHHAHLQETAEQVLVFWEAVQNLTRWLAELAFEVAEARRDQPLDWEDINELISAEVALSCDLREPSWTDSVRLVGTADALVRVPGRGSFCAVELKLGRARPVVDLGQAALYRLITARASKTPGALALLRFSPVLEETLIDASQGADADARLLDLVARLAGVAGEPQRERPTGRMSAAATRASSTTAKAKASASKAGNAKATTTNAKVVTATPPRDDVNALKSDASVRAADARYADLGQRLVRAFREYGPVVEIAAEPAVGPRFLRFEARLGRGVTFDQVVRRTTEVHLKVGLAKEPIITKIGGRLCIDVERPDPQVVPFSAIEGELGPRRGAARVPIGVDLDGKLHAADLASPVNAHLLVAGTTGSGKTEWLRMAIAGLLRTNTPDTLRLLLIDPKLAAFTELKRSPYLWEKHGLWVPGGSDVVDVLDDLVAEMDRRYRLLADAGVDDLARYLEKTRATLPRIVCFCDEYFALISQDRQQKKQIEASIALLGAKARASGIHLVIATQQPSRQVIQGPLDANIPCRVGLMTQTAIESRMLLRTPGAERLTGFGDLLYKDLGDPIRLQAPYVSPEERARIFAGR
ncbi:Cell division protein FtsK [Minicystis rosea]|nr:Cell division protein FtsK [Minicystis rosea]